MIKKVISIIIIFTLTVLTLCSCGKSDEVNLVMAVNADPQCLDPQIADSETAKLIINNCYEGLVRLNENNEIIPGAAEVWEVSSDGLTYTFHIRKDAHWQLLDSFGETLDDENFKDTFSSNVTANDFQFGLRRALTPVTQAEEAKKLYCIKNARAVNTGKADPSTLGVTAVDDSTLVIKLEKANGDFLRLLTMPICMPCNEEFFTATHAKYGLEVKYTMCNGPFYLSRWVEDNSVVIRKNDGYKGSSEVKPTAVYFYINSDESSVITKLRGHNYDCAWISESAHLSLSDNKSVSQIATDNAVTGFCFNCKDEALSNENLRRAILMMTQFDKITAPASVSGSARGIIPDCCRFGAKQYREAAGSVTGLKYDEKNAVELWKKGLNELEYENATVTIACTEEYASQMQNLIQNWQKLLGIRIIAKVEVLSADELNDAVKNGQFQIAVSSVNANDSTAADTLKAFKSGGKGNIFGFSDESFDAEIEKLINGDSGEKLITDLRAAEEYIINKGVFYPLFTDSRYIAINSGVTGVYAAPSFESITFINGGRK